MIRLAKLKIRTIILATLVVQIIGVALTLYYSPDIPDDTRSYPYTIVDQNQLDVSKAGYRIQTIGGVKFLQDSSRVTVTFKHLNTATDFKTSNESANPISYSHGLSPNLFFSYPGAVFDIDGDNLDELLFNKYYPYSNKLNTTLFLPLDSISVGWLDAEYGLNNLTTVTRPEGWDSNDGSWNTKVDIFTKLDRIQSVETERYCYLRQYGYLENYAERKLLVIQKGVTPEIVRTVSFPQRPVAGDVYHDSDGRRHLLIGGYFPCNNIQRTITIHREDGSIILDTLDDVHASVLQTDELGNIEWATKFRRGGNRTFVYAPPELEKPIVAFYYRKTFLEKMNKPASLPTNWPEITERSWIRWKYPVR